MNKDMVGITIIVSVVFILFSMPGWFQKIDCYNAEQALAFMKQCEANEDCRLTVRELETKHSFMRLKLRSCKEE